MSKIDKLSIDMPPNSMFQPISTDYRNNLTYVEYLLGILKKLNEMIEQVNSNTEFINGYSGDIERLENEFNELVSENERFKLNLQIDINNQLSAFRREVTNQLNVQIAGLKAYVDEQDNELKDYIDGIALGQIELYNPSTGMMDSLQNIINDMYDMDRTDAITATEYDGLELTATAYEAYDLTASDYDFHAKSLLV